MTIPEYLVGLGRKVELTDVTPALVAAADEWLAHYTGNFDFLLSVRARVANKPMTPAQAKGVLNCWRADLNKAAKASPANPDAQAIEPGVYVAPDGTIWKVQANKAKTNVYAKVWTAISGERLTLEGEHVNAEWRYAPGAINHLDATHKMTLEQAKQFTTLYGRCVRCGRQLKDAKSVEQAIGPVCINYFGGFAEAA